MSHIRVLICRVDEPTSDTLTELAAFDLPAADVTALQPDTALEIWKLPPRRPVMPSCGSSSRPNGISSTPN